MSKQIKCKCGAVFPWHLIELGIPAYKHVCSCGRLYKFENGLPVYLGDERNPFATDKAAGEEDEEERTCPKCGSALLAGYGFAGGGVGGYFMCDNEACDYFEKTSDPAASTSTT